MISVPWALGAILTTALVSFIAGMLEERHGFKSSGYWACFGVMGAVMLSFWANVHWNPA